MNIFAAQTGHHHLRRLVALRIISIAAQGAALAMAAFVFTMHLPWTPLVATIAVQAVVEMVSLPGSEADPTPVSATNVFELTEHGWRLVIHHASPLPPPERAPEVETPAKTHVLH